MANKIDQIKVGSTTYDIVPNAVDNGDYKASCPALTSDTILEVQSNKITAINSSTTDSQYPSAKAVYDALPKLSGTASAADVRKGKTFYKDSAIAQTGTMPDSSLSVSSSNLTVSPAVTPTAMASATGNISLTVAGAKPSSGYYIAATGGNSKTTGSSTSGSSLTVSAAAGYIAASSKTVTSSAAATANASSKTAYYTIPTASFNKGFSYDDAQADYAIYLTTAAGYSVEQKITSFELADGEKLYNYTSSGATYSIDLKAGTHLLTNTGTIDYLNNGITANNPGKIDVFNTYGQINDVNNIGIINDIHNGTSDGITRAEIGTLYNYPKSITRKLANYGTIDALENDGGTITALSNGISLSGTIVTFNNGATNRAGNVIQTLNNNISNTIGTLTNYGSISNLFVRTSGLINNLVLYNGVINTLASSTSATIKQFGTGTFAINSMPGEYNILQHSGGMTINKNTSTGTVNIVANEGTVKYIS